MRIRWRRHIPWLAAWLLLAGLGAAWLVHAELNRLEDTLDAQARTVHRLLSQRAGQNDAVLATLLAGPQAVPEAARAQGRADPMPYAHIVSVQQRRGEATWDQPALAEAEAESQRLRRPVIAQAQLDRGRYALVLAGESAAARIGVDLRSMVPWAEWPMPAETSPVRVELSLGEQAYVLQPGLGAATGAWRMALAEPLASESQPLRLSLSRPVGASDLPWSAVLSWALGVAVLLLAARAVLRQRADRRRAQALLRMGQVERQSVLVDMAGGIGQELGAPLQQTLANLKAAQQVLDEDPPDLLTGRLAVREAIAHAQRAAQTVSRLQHVASQPDLSERIQVLDPLAAVRQALDLLEPETRRRGVRVRLEPGEPNLRVFADPGAVAQILHNLLLNALQALDQVQISDRELTLSVSTQGSWGRIAVRDTGPGIPTDVLPHVFEPFFTTRDGALGLGLTHSESLALAMGGTLTAFNHAPRGAEFCLSLPVASMP